MTLIPRFLVGRTAKHIFGWLLGASFCWGTAIFVVGQEPLEQAERKRQVTSERQLNSDLKVLLNDYYSGKPVRAKVVIPANERGIEVVDGLLKVHPLTELTAAVQPGELVLIKELRFKNKEIEVRFDGEYLKEPVHTAPPPGVPGLTPVGPHGSDATVGPPPAALVAKAPKSVKSLPDPRVILRFSRDIETRDLNLQSINRLLSPAVDVTTLAPTPVPEGTTTTAARPRAFERAQQTAAEQGIPVAPITGNLVGAAPNIGELVIECSIAGARLYIDGTYSGTAPRTVQLLMGVHTVLIVAPGQQQFEQKFFLPPGKVAVIKADFNQK
jgi:hypothetical protein